MRVSRKSVPCVILVCCIALSSAAAGGPQDKAALADTTFAAASVKPVVSVQAYPFNLKNVRLLDGPFKAAMERDLGYMASLDNDRLLHMFRVTAGLPSTAEAYGGWEKADIEVRGHPEPGFFPLYQGKAISSLAMARPSWSLRARLVIAGGRGAELTSPPGRRYNSGMGQGERFVAQSENSARMEKAKSYSFWLTCYLDMNTDTRYNSILPLIKMPALNRLKIWDGHLWIN